MAKKETTTEGSSILERLKKTSTIKESSVLEDSKFFEAKDLIMTRVPSLNIAFSGSVTGGFGAGVTVLAGPSKHFKTGVALIQAKAFLDKYEDGVILFYDSEFGSPQGYFESLGIPLDRVFHTPIQDIEQLKFDIMKQLYELDEKDHVMIIIDSIGNTASKKEVDDALEGSNKSDMTRAKQIKSLFRMITPHLNMKDIPLVAIAHIYMTQEMYAKAIVSGGTGIYYSADTIFIIGRQQDKEGTALQGFHFIINVEKSRFVYEKSKVPLSVSYENGINKYSGLLELGQEFGFVTKPKLARYHRPGIDAEGKNWSEDDTSCDEFWDPILEDPAFDDACRKKYQLGASEGNNIFTSEAEKA